MDVIMEDKLSKFKKYNNCKYIMGSHIKYVKSQIGKVDVISGNYIIIGNVEGLNDWIDKSRKEFLRTPDNSFTLGEIYNKLLVLTCGSLYTEEDIKRLEKINESKFYELIKNDENYSNIDEYYIYYFNVDYMYQNDTLFLILPYLDEGLVVEQRNFISYQIIKKSEIYTHIMEHDVDYIIKEKIDENKTNSYRLYDVPMSEYIIDH